mmetsp:Transcript_59043/g.155474  ORF Transcript_59043/g.155474 Transcript_59043/m.155474 type:complete len:207 (-) Transcript_59043:165-785(-)
MDHLHVGHVALLHRRDEGLHLRVQERLGHLRVGEGQRPHRLGHLGVGLRGRLQGVGHALLAPGERRLQGVAPGGRGELGGRRGGRRGRLLLLLRPQVQDQGGLGRRLGLLLLLALAEAARQEALLDAAGAVERRRRRRLPRLLGILLHLLARGQRLLHERLRRRVRLPGTRRQDVGAGLRTLGLRGGRHLRHRGRPRRPRGGCAVR